MGTKYLKSIVLVIIMIFIQLWSCNELLSYNTCTYVNKKLYFYDTRNTSDNGGGYFLVGALLGNAYPAIWGGLLVISGIGAILDSREYLVGSATGLIGATEILLQNSANKTPIYILNGGLIGLYLWSAIVPPNLEFPPQKIQIFSHFFYRNDIGLDYENARNIYIFLIDSGYISAPQLSGSSFTQKYSPSEAIIFPDNLKRFEAHVNWVLTQIYLYNQQSKNPNIIFEVPPTTNLTTIPEPLTKLIPSSIPIIRSMEISKPLSIPMVNRFDIPMTPIKDWTVCGII